MNRFAHFRTPAAATSLAIVAALLALVLVTSARSPAADPKPESKTVVKVEEARFASVDKAITDNVGKVVLVDVWATWCGPCVKKWPAVAALNKTYRDKGLVLVTASLDKGHRGYKINKVLDFLSDRGATGPNFVMSDPAADRADATKKIGIGDGIPYLTLFDKKGKRIWDSDAKNLSDKELAALIESELAK